MHEPTTAESVLPADWPPEVQLPPPDLWSDEPPMESDVHRKQMEILIQSAENWFGDRQDFYATGNLTIYYSPNQRKSEDFRGPDFFLVLGAERRERRSWIVWHEGGRYPDVIIEILSSSTAEVDRGLKKTIYSTTFRTPEYYLFDPDNLQLQGFHLSNGQYEDLLPGDHNRLWSRQMGVFLGVHDGRLRFFAPDGALVLLNGEQAEQERQRAEAIALENTRLRERLQALGVDPDAI